MTLDADRLRELHEAATPTPWFKHINHRVAAGRKGAVGVLTMEWTQGPPNFIPRDEVEPSLELLVLLRNAVPDILALIKENAVLRADLLEAHQEASAAEMERDEANKHLESMADAIGCVECCDLLPCQVHDLEAVRSFLSRVDAAPATNGTTDTPKDGA